MTKQCRSRSVGFFRFQLILIYTVCKGKVYLGSAGPGFIPITCFSLEIRKKCTYFLVKRDVISPCHLFWRNDEAGLNQAEIFSRLSYSALEMSEEAKKARRSR